MKRFRTSQRLVAVWSVAGLALGVAAGCSPGPASSAAAADGAEATADREADTEQVAAVRQDVVETTKVESSVGFGTVITLPLMAEGIVTSAPEPRTVVRSGDVLVEVAGRPVVLVVGDSALYRPLRLVARGERDEAGTRIGSLKGPDVGQLQQYLLDEGFDDKGRMKVDELFGLSTHRAVKDWQASVGHPATGVIDASQMVFMSTSVLVASNLTVGQQFEQLDVTGTETVLTIEGSTTLREFFTVGSEVEVQSVPPVTGVVTRSTRLNNRGDGGGAGQFIEITVDGVAPDELGDSIAVVGSVSRANDVITIPVRALLAVSDGGWKVEVASGSGTDFVPVELVEVVGTTAIVEGIDEGTEVVVPL